MKLIGILFTILFICSNSDLYSQKNQTAINPGGKFDFASYIFSSGNLYKEIMQDEIKAVRLSVREIFSSDQASSYLFYPQKQEGNQTNLMDLLLWAIRQKGVPFYDYFTDQAFSTPLSVKDLDSLLKRHLHTGDSTITADISSPSGYLVLEAWIYGNNDKIMTVRPIGLTPFSTYTYKNGSETITNKYALFQVYFPDIMDLLAHHHPSKKISGIKSTLDLFLKNLYGGTNISRSYFGDFLTGLNTDTDSTQITRVFDTLWLAERLKNGIFINPQNSKLNGNPRDGSAIHSNLSSEKPFEPSSISCTQVVQKQIDLRDAANYSIYFPLEKAYGNKSLAEVILDGLKKAAFFAFDYYTDTSLSMPLTVEEIDKKMSETLTLETPSSDGMNIVDTIVRTDYPASGIKYYLLKEALFYDSVSKFIGSRPVSLTPVLEKNDSNIGRVIKIPLFEIPFSDQNFRSLLAENNITRFGPLKPMSYLSFLLNSEYSVEKADTFPASSAELMRELGLKPPVHKNSIAINYRTTISGLKGGRFITREINKSDTANYPLFYTGYRNFGFTMFFDLLRDALLKNNIKACQYSESALPGEILSGNELTDKLGQQVIMLDPETGNDRIVRVNFSSDEIEKYLVMEIVSDSLIIPFAICPVKGTKYSDSHENLFWVCFSEQFRKTACNQEVLRLNCEPEKTFLDYLLARRYKGKVLNENPLIPAEMNKIIPKLD